MNQINTFIFTVLRISIYTLGNNKKYLHTQGRQKTVAMFANINYEKSSKIKFYFCYRFKILNNSSTGK
jgi:hypothetical protein